MIATFIIKWTVIACIGFIVGIFIRGILEPNYTDNDIWVCPNCDIATRELLLKLHSRTLEDPRWKKMKCPHCEAEKNFTKDDERTTPLSPSLSLRKRREIDKALRESIISNDTSNQIDKYLQLQEEKLKRMKGAQAKNDESF